MIKSTRVQLIVIAASLILTTGILSLCAYLVDNKNQNFTLNSVSGDGVSIDIETSEYDPDSPESHLLPGSMAELDPYIKNKGSNAPYVFVAYDSEYLTPVDIDDDNWTSFQSGDTTIYAYTDDMGLAPVTDKTTPVFSNVKLSPTITSMESSYDLSVTAYAIQSAGIESNDPEEVYALVKETLVSSGD